MKRRLTTASQHLTETILFFFNEGKCAESMSIELKAYHADLWVGLNKVLIINNFEILFLNATQNPFYLICLSHMSNSFSSLQ
jgi:hypothetical protein